MQLIEHINYGKGKIRKKRFGGFELYVEFEDGIDRWVRRDEIRFLSETPILTKHKPSEVSISKEQFNARQIIEALRLGIVPHEHVEEFTFGRAEEIKRVKNWLDNPKVGTFLIIGEYGVGKTHLLEYIYSFALNNNWAVSMIDLDPNEATFHKPKYIYQKIISSFKFKSRDGGFREFLRQISIDSDYYKLNTHEYLGRIVKEIKNGNESEEKWAWIEGNPSRYFYPPLYKYSTCANIYCYILNGIGWAARNVLGLNGLLILFDEAEIVDPDWYTSYQSHKVWNFLKGLILMASNDISLFNEGIEFRHDYDTGLGNYRGYFGKETNLQYCGYSQLPYIWKFPSHVKIIFTFTPISSILEEDLFKDLPTFEIERLNDESYMKIFRTIIKLYQRAYNFHPKNDEELKFFDRMRQDKTRLFVKGVTEALDLKRFYPDKSLEILL